MLLRNEVEAQIRDERDRKRVEHRSDAEALTQRDPREQHHQTGEHNDDPERQAGRLRDTLMEYVPRRDAELGAHGNRDREPEDEEAQHEWWEPAPELARAGPRQHARVLRVIVGGRRTHSSPAADSA